MAVKETSSRNTRVTLSRQRSTLQKQTKRNLIPKLKNVDRPTFPGEESFKASLALFRRHAQLELLERVSQLSTPEDFTLGKAGHEAHMRREIAAVEREFLARTGHHLRTRQLLDLALQAASSDAPPGGRSESVWNEDERSLLSSIRKDSLERQRGRLSAMMLHEQTRLAAQSPEVAADALFCLLTDGEPRTWHASKLMNLRDQHQDQIQSHAEAARKALNNHFIQFGMEMLVKPMIVVQYPDPAEQQRLLRDITGKQQQYDTILQLLDQAHAMQSGGKVLSADSTQVVDELDRLLEAMQKCSVEMQKAESRALDHQLQDILVAQLPADTRKALDALLSQPSVHARQLTVLLYAARTEPRHFLETCKTDAERLDLLRFVRGGKPALCFVFAQKLSELLRFAGDQADQFLADVENLLVAQLGPDKTADQKNLLPGLTSQPNGQGTVSAQVRRIVDEVEQMLLPPADEEHDPGSQSD